MECHQRCWSRDGEPALGGPLPGEGWGWGAMAPDSSVTLPFSSFSLRPGREIKPPAFHTRHHHSLPPMQPLLAPAPGPQAVSAVTLQTCAGEGRHSLRSIPRAIHHGLSSRRPTVSQEVQTPRKAGSGSTEGATALPPAYMFPGRLTGRQHSGGKLLSWPGRSASAVTGHRRKRRVC